MRKLYILFLSIFLVSTSQSAVLSDVVGSNKVEKVVSEIRNIRIALEKYYQLTGRYPDLSKPGASENLRLLDYRNENGEIISFAEIYGRNILAETPADGEKFPASNKVYNLQDFSKGNNRGGWNYNYNGMTGELHPNLPRNMYGEDINWTKQ